MYIIFGPYWVYRLSAVCKTLFKTINTASLVYNFYIERLSSQVNVLTKTNERNKKAQLSLTNPRDAKACQKLLYFDVLTTLSLTTLAYLHSFSCCCVRNLRNTEKFTENSNLWSLRSSKVISISVSMESPCVTSY